MKKLMIYVHGKGGSPTEAEHYKPLCPAHDVIGLDYRSETPWEAAEEFPQLWEKITPGYNSVNVIANSIGAYFTIHALRDKKIERLLLISPVVDMERLITDMMSWGRISEEELCEKKTIATPFGENLSWEYLSYVRKNPIGFSGDIRILYGGRDEIIARDSVEGFAKKHNASLTVMENSVHWFHTSEQLDFLDEWVKQNV